MASYKKVKTLHPTDAAYIAGLVDGEGTITLSRKHRDENRQLVLSISNTELPLLDYVLHIVYAGKITKKKTAQKHHTPSATYAVTNRQALDLITQIYPFLKTHKKYRAKLVMDDYIRLTPRNGKYTDKMKKQRSEFIERFFAYKPNLD